MAGHSVKLEWKAPPNRGGLNHADIAAQLRARPGEWANPPTYTNPATARSVADQIRSAALAAYAPKGAFEATTVNGELYIRYVGEGS